MNNESELQEKFMEYQVLKQEVESLSKLIQEVESRKQEYEVIVEAIESLGGKKKDVLLPVASGVFVKSDVTEDNLFINLGSGVIGKKDFKSGVEYLKKQLEDLDKTQESLMQELNVTYDRIGILEEDLERIQRMAQDKNNKNEEHKHDENCKH